MAKTLATQRSLKELRKRGWQCAIVEKWLPPRGKMKFGIRQDLWGFADILACKPDTHSFALIQTFPMARWKDHAEKLAAIPELQVWKQTGGVVLMHGWRFGGPRGQKKQWILKEEAI
jgi:hypothetical protein